MPSSIGSRFDSAVRWLRKNHPPKSGLPVTVNTSQKVVIGKDRCWGTQDFYPGHGWKIVIDRKQDESHAVECLIHEWAHCLSDEVEPISDSHAAHHSDQWGIFYARLYRGLDEYETQRDKDG